MTAAPRRLRLLLPRRALSSCNVLKSSELIFLLVSSLAAVWLSVYRCEHKWGAQVKLLVYGMIRMMSNLITLYSPETAAAVIKSVIIEIGFIGSVFSSIRCGISFRFFVVVRF